MTGRARTATWEKFSRIRRLRRYQNAATIGLVVLGPVLVLATFLVLGPLDGTSSTLALRLVLLAATMMASTHADGDKKCFGNRSELINAIALSMEEPNRLKIQTQMQALRYIGQKIRSPKLGRRAFDRPRSCQSKDHAAATQVITRYCWR